MSYEVINHFKDEDGKVYKVGDKYDKKLTKAREEILSTKDNAYGKAFLKKKEEPKKKKK